MARGKSYAMYTAGDGSTYATLVDKNKISDATRGWGALTTPAHLLPRGFKERRVYGISPTSGRRASTRVGSTAADLWTGTATSFTDETDDAGTDTYNVVGKRDEYERIPHA